MINIDYSPLVVFFIVIGVVTVAINIVRFTMWAFVTVEGWLTKRATDAASPASKNGEGSKKPRR